MLKEFLPRYPEELDRAREAVLSLARAEGVEAAYIGGALAAGLGTPMSDVDVYFVVADGTPSAARQLFVDGRRFDVAYQSVGSLRALIAETSHYRADRDDLGVLNTMGRKSLAPLVRFLLGEVVLDDGSIAALASLARQSLPELVRTVVGVMSFEVHNALEDAHGFHAVGDLEAASWAGQLAFLSAAEALLAAHGDLYLGQKWVWARWARTFGADLALPSPAAATADPVAFGDAVAVCQDLLIQAITGRTYPLRRGWPPASWAVRRRPARSRCATPCSSTCAAATRPRSAGRVSCSSGWPTVAPARRPCG